MQPSVTCVTSPTSLAGRHLLFFLVLISLVLGVIGTAAAQDDRRRFNAPPRIGAAPARAVGVQPARGNQFRQPPFNRTSIQRGNLKANINRQNTNINHQSANANRQRPQFGQKRTPQHQQGFNRQRANRFARPGFMRNGLPRRPMIGERGFTGVPPRGETRFVSNEMVFHVPQNVSPQQVDDALRRAGVTSVGSENLSVTGGRLYRLRINDGRQVADVVRSLEQQNIGTAQPNYVYRAQQASRALPAGDPSQYAVAKLKLIEAHRIATGKDVVIAMIDSRIDAAHPDIAGAVVAEFDPAGNRDRPDNHGTGMTGAIVAHQKLLGVAPGVKILAVHAFSPDAKNSPQATSQHILAGIDWAIQKGARIINMSFAGPYDPMMQLALKKAHDKGIVLIAAAGNMGPRSQPLYPAADENVIAVTATDKSDKLLPQANQGPHIALAAPGVDILEPAPNASYQVTSGTSVAAAHVSGVAALIIERQPEIDDASLEELLTSTAKDLGPAGRDDEFGYGLVDPYRALNALEAKIAAGGATKPAPAPAAAQAVTMKPLPRSAQTTTATQVSMASNNAAISLPNPAPTGPQVGLPPLTDAEREAARAALHKRRQICRQDGVSQQMRGDVLRDYITACVAETRAACRKQAIVQKIAVPARRQFLNSCIAAE